MNISISGLGDIEIDIIDTPIISNIERGVYSFDLSSEEHKILFHILAKRPAFTLVRYGKKIHFKKYVFSVLIEVTSQVKIRYTIQEVS